MALNGIQVLEIGGLAPGPFCGQILADFGADVIRVDRWPDSHYGGPVFWNRNKKSIALNLKKKEGIQVLLKLIEKSDVFIDPWRPGVAEKLGVGPEVALQLNPRLIYARLTGWGQTGNLAKTAGHDTNYLAITGALALFARANERPLPPVNLLGDFAGGGLLCAFGIVLALWERNRSGKGQVIDSAMIDGVTYLSTFVYKHFRAGLWSTEAGTNLLDTGAPFYEIYETKDGRHMSVGALEPQFYALFIEGLGLAKADLPSQHDRDRWPELRAIFEKRFREKTFKEWQEIFSQSDACVAPVLKMDEVMDHPHNKARELLSPVDHLPSPAPRLSRTPAIISSESQDFEPGSHTTEVLRRFGFSANAVEKLLQDEVIGPQLKSKL